MIFADRFTIQERIELLQRSILVNSYAYYELNENILTDFQYDANTRMLRQLKRDFPEEYSKSRYFKYFEHFSAVVAESTGNGSRAPDAAIEDGGGEIKIDPAVILLDLFRIGREASVLRRANRNAGSNVL